MARNDPAAMADQPEDDRVFGFLVHDVSRLIRGRFNRRARETGLSITRLQASVILHIAHHQGVSQTSVAAVLDIEPIALVRMLDRLHEEGLVERRAHPTDRRVRALWLTPEAAPVIERILAITRAIGDEAFAGVLGAQRDTLIEALDQIKGNLLRHDEAASAPVDPPSPSERIAS